MDSTTRLSNLREDFLATSTQSMPIAGMLYWAVVGVAALRVTPQQLAYIVGFGSGTIFPLALLIDRLRGRIIRLSSSSNPVTQMFLQSLAVVALLWPLVLIAAFQARSANLIVLGGAILMGIIWIPWGWAANDPVGLRHAIARCVLSYACFLFVPAPYTATAISIAVLLCYLYSLLFMRKPAA
jgi:hypothetical protein